MLVGTVVCVAVALGYGLFQTMQLCLDEFQGSSAVVLVGSLST